MIVVAYTVAVLFTFPLQNYPALEITCRSISHSLSTSTYLLNNMPPRIHQWIMERNTIAAGLVCVLAVVALTTMDELDKVVSLMGVSESACAYVEEKIVVSGNYTLRYFNEIRLTASISVLCRAW